MIANNILIRNRNFRNLVITDMFTKFADSMDNVIITLLVIKLTGSSTSTGILLAITTLPGILFSLIGGTLSDMKSQKKILTMMTVLQAGLLLVLAFLVKVDKISFLLLCILLFVLESLSRFYSPALTSAVVNVVSKEDYNQAIATRSTAESIVQMVGSSLCATFVTFIGYAATLLVNSFSYVSSSILASKLKIKSNMNTQKTSVEDVLSNAKLGMNYVMSNGTILGLILVISLINFILAWFDVALPFLLTDSLHIPVESLGYIKAVSTFMFIIAGIVMSLYKVKRIKQTILVSIAVFGGAVLGLSYVKGVYTLALIWGGAAFFRTIVSLLLVAELTYFSDKNMIGRVMGFFMLITSVSMFLSRLLSGKLVSYFGASTTFKIAGFMLIIIAIISFKMIPKRKIEIVE